MFFVAIFNLIGLLVILSDLDWKWVSIDKPLHFTHSIFGIVAMGLIYFQLFLGLLRPKKESRLRKGYKYVHGTVGITAFIFSIVAMFLGVLMEEMNLARLGWCIMIGWILWVIIFPLVMEILKISKIGVNKRSTPYQLPGTLRENYETLDKYKKIFHGIKSFFMAMHLLIALG